MNIEKYTLKNGEVRYQFQIYLGVDPKTGKVKQTRRRGFKTIKEAQLAYVRIENGLDLALNNETFGDIYKEWMDGYKATVKESTLNKTLSYFRLHILPELGDYKIQKITLHDIQSAVNKWYEKTTHYGQIKNYTSQVFKHAMRLDIIQKNPCDLVIMPKPKSKTDEENYYDKEELEIFLKAAKEGLSQMWYTFFYLLAFTGMRRGEAMALTWKDLTGSSIKVNKTFTVGLDGKQIQQPTKTKAGTRDIPLDKKTLDLLRRWKKKQKEELKQGKIIYISKEQLIFNSVKNKPISFSLPAKKLESVIKKYGLKKITSHGFRHTHCSLLFEAGASIAQVQKRLGHADVQTTMNIYNHVSKFKEVETAELFSAYVNI